MLYLSHKITQIGKNSIMTKIRQLPNSQFITTIPKKIAEAMRLKKGDKIDWLFIMGDVVVRKC